MKSPFKNVGIAMRPDMPEIQDTIHTLVSFLREDDFIIYPDELSIEEHCVYIQDSAYCETVNRAQLDKYYGLIVVLGGNGTFLSAARGVAPCAVPIVGINQGHLGFLTQVSHDTMVEGIRPVLESKYLPERRILIKASIIRDGETIERALVLNDTILSRGGAGQMIEFEVFIGQEFVYTQCSDDLIISTSTGSTAYTLVTGDSIVQTGLRAFMLVSICPQSITSHPITIPDTNVVEALITKSGDVRVHFDGQSHINMQNFGRIIIRRYHNPLRVPHPTDYQCFKTPRQKLHWGEQLI